MSNGACLFAVLACLLLPAPGVLAAEPGSAEVIVTAKPRQACEQATQADPYACLNAEMAQLVARQRPQQDLLVDLATSSLPQTAPEQGLYNQAALRIRMGNNFGRSVYPQRPPPAQTLPPLIH
ncbi:MAG: hypothetical protein ACREVL_15775 [Solimonas sp.]